LIIIIIIIIIIWYDAQSSKNKTRYNGCTACIVYNASAVSSTVQF